MAQKNIIVPSDMDTVEIEPCEPVKNLQVYNGANGCVVYLTWEEPINEFVTDGDVPVSYGIYYNGSKIGNTTELTYVHTITISGDNRFCVSAVYENCESESVCKDVYTPCFPFCPPVSNLTAMQQGSTVLLEWTAAAGDPIEYKVYNGMDEVATVANTEYIFENLAPGEYIFGVEALFGYSCQPIMVHIGFIVDAVGVGEVGISGLILIYPNPTKRELQVTSYELQVTGVEIVDLMGRKVLSQKAEGRKQNELDISHLPTGMYFVQIITDSGVITKKIIKQ